MELTPTLRLAVAVLGVFTFAGAPRLHADQDKPTPTQTAAIAKDGWWIQVNTGTAATEITWQFGTTPDDLTNKDPWQVGSRRESLCQIRCVQRKRSMFGPPQRLQMPQHLSVCSGSNRPWHWSSSPERQLANLTPARRSHSAERGSSNEQVN